MLWAHTQNTPNVVHLIFHTATHDHSRPRGERQHSSQHVDGGGFASTIVAKKDKYLALKTPPVGHSVRISSTPMNKRTQSNLVHVQIQALNGHIIFPIIQGECFSQLPVRAFEFAHRDRFETSRHK
jgi:hypothetical protein